MGSYLFIEEEKLAALKIDWHKQGGSIRDIALKHGMSRGAVARLAERQNWPHRALAMPSRVLPDVIADLQSWTGSNAEFAARHQISQTTVQRVARAIGIAPPQPEAALRMIKRAPNYTPRDIPPVAGMAPHDQHSASQCRWFYERTDSRVFMFCDQPRLAPASSYCRQHYAIAYGREAA